MKLERNKVIHNTVGVKQGDWIIYRCPLCDYEMHDNVVTHEMIVKNPKSDIGHKGTYKPFTEEQGTQRPYCRPTWILN